MRRLVGVFVGALVVAGVIVGGAELAGSGGGSRADAVAAYKEAVQAPARDGGFVVQAGLKQGLSQVASGQAGNVVFQAVSWVEQLEQVRARFAAAVGDTDDERLRVVARAFDESLVLYKQTAETIGAAAMASGEPRIRLLEQAVARGREADERYDLAMATLKELSS